MKSIFILDPLDPEQTQVRFKSNYPDTETYFFSTVSDFFEKIDEFRKKGIKPSVIVMEAEFPKEEKGMIFGCKRVRTPYSIIMFLRKQGYRFVIYTRGTKEKSFKEIKKSFGRLKIDVLNKDCEKDELRKIMDKYLKLDFANAKIKKFR